MKYRISSWQAFCSYFIIITLAIGLPSTLIRVLGQDFWQAMIIALVVDLVLGWFLYKMGLKYKGKTIFEYSEIILGKVVGKLFVGLLSFFFLLVAFDITLGLMDFYSSLIMPETPKSMFALLILLVSTYAVCSGIEPIMRLSELFAPVIMGSYLFIMLFNVDEMELGKLQPLFQHSLGEVLQGAVYPTIWLAVCIIMGVIMAYHNATQEMYKIKCLGVGLGTLIVAAMIACVIMVNGVEVSSEQKFSIFILASMVRIGDFIERLEAFQVAAWTAGGFYIVTFFHYAGVEGLKALFPKRSKFFLTVGSALLLFLLSVLLMPSSHDISAYRQSFFPFVCLVIEFGGVISLYLIFVLKQKLNGARKRS